MDFKQQIDTNQSAANDITGSDLIGQTVSPYYAKDRVKTPICIELRMPDGARRAMPYSLITEIYFHVDLGIEILTIKNRIRIIGRNLTELFDTLIIFRVRYIQANVGSDDSEAGLFVSEILFEDLG